MTHNDIEDLVIARDGTRVAEGDEATVDVVFAICMSRQAVELPAATVRMSVLPPFPAPIVSPPTINNCVPARRAGVHTNESLVGDPDSIREDAPPGMTSNTSTGGCALAE